MPIVVSGEAIRRGEVPDPLGELRLLPMFYLFPAELLVHSEFMDFPRNPYVVFETPKWREKYHDKKFLETVSDGMADMIWRHFGIKAPMEDFSGYYPFWMLARFGEWINIAARCGYNTLTLATASPTYQLPIFTYEEADATFKTFVDIFRKENPMLSEWIKTVHEHPAHEDYEPSRKDRRIYKDFLRKWYHSRSKWVQPASVHTEDDWEKLNAVELLANPYLQVDFQMDFEKFSHSLPEKEQKILQLLLEGYTLAQIAQIVGYANHSTVSKKVTQIAARYKDFTAKAKKMPPPPVKVKNNWDEMSVILSQPYKR